LKRKREGRQAEKTTADGWFTRRMMRLTRAEKRAMASARQSEHTKRTALALLDHASLPPEPYCLELGCGQGALARLLVERYDAHLVATDLDPEHVALARERCADLDGRIEFRVVDARQIPYEARQFDAVFCFGVMHHVPGSWRRIVAEVSRVLEPGGWFVFTDFVLHSRSGRMFRRLVPWLDQLEEDELHNCLAENGLHLAHYARGRNLLAGLMKYCTAVAQKVEGEERDG